MGTVLINGIPYGGYTGSGGGGNSGVYIEETLWEGSQSTSAWASPIELAINVDNYDFILIQLFSQAEQIVSVRQIPVGDNTGDDSIAVGALRDGQSPKTAWLNKNTNILRVFTSTGISITLTKIVGIKVSGNHFAPQIYSTEEREVGVWIDGKPLYQKTINNIVLPNNGSVNLSTPQNIDELVYCFGVAYSTSNTGYFRPIPFAAGGTNDIRLDMTEGTLRFVTFSDWSGYAAKVTIFYTKTTDVAGSGSWTPSGVPAHHYSTDEQVVGTWIDGSTVYEKIFDLGSDVSYGAGWHRLDIPKGNINRIFDGLFISDSGVSCDIGLACNDTTYLEILVYSGTTQVLGRYIKARYTKGGA